MTPPSFCLNKPGLLAAAVLLLRLTDGGGIKGDAASSLIREGRRRDLITTERMEPEAMRKAEKAASRIFVLSLFKKSRSAARAGRSRFFQTGRGAGGEIFFHRPKRHEIKFVKVFLFALPSPMHIF